MKKEVLLSEQEGCEIKERIDKEDLLPFKESCSLHIIETRYMIDGKEYAIYEAIGKDISSNVYLVEKK